MDSEDIFERIFGCNRNDELATTPSEYFLAKYSFELAGDEIKRPEKFKSQSFENELKAAEEIFKRVINLFKRNSVAKTDFINKFPNWSSDRKENVQSLRNIVTDMQSDKFNCDIAKVVGGSVGAVGGTALLVSLFTPAAFITVPLAIGGGIASALGGATVIGTTIEEEKRITSNLETATELTKKNTFQQYEQWSLLSGELKEALGSLVSYSLFKSMTEYLQDFNKETIGISEVDFENRFKQVLKLCFRKMCEDSDLISQYGVVIAPVIMTFVIVFCLMRYENRKVLDYILKVDNLVGNMTGVKTKPIAAQRWVEDTILASRIGAMGTLTNALDKVGTRGMFEITTKTTLGKAATRGTLVAAGVAIDILTVVMSSIALHNQPMTEHAKQVKEAAETLEEELKFIEMVYRNIK